MTKKATLPIKDLPSDPNEKALLKTQEAPDIEAPSGIDTKYHTQGDGSITIERVADVQNVLDRAAFLRNNGLTKTAMGDHHVGTIPKIIIEKYCNQNGITFHDFCVDDTHITRILNDSQYSLFRIHGGRV